LVLGKLTLCVYKVEANVSSGHLHDGGTHVTLTVDGKEVCRSEATYGKSAKGGMGGPSGPPAAGATDAHSHAVKADSEHIVKMSGCPGEKMPVRNLVKGQKWVLNAFYDLDAHQGMKNSKGTQENVMGISIMYIKNPKY
jgi:hypothetical protein